MKYNVKQLINEAKIVSFDIFDTLILRNVIFPEDVFDVVERRYRHDYGMLGFSYREERLGAESEARKNMSGSDEITLDEIYDILRVNVNLSNETIEKLKELEIDLEMAFSTKNNYIHSLYKYCLKRNKRIIIVSDMYLPKEVVEKILENNSYTRYERLFLSSSLGKTKASGSMYSYIIQELDVKQGEILHIGDNLSTDIGIAREQGFKAFYYERCASRALKCREFKETGWFHSLNVNRCVGDSFQTALIVNKFYNDPGKKTNNFWYELGYKTLGIMFLGFSSWIFNEVRENKLEKVFFLSRDGYILKKAYDIFSQYYRDSVSSEYFYASRRLFSIASIDPSKSNQEEFLRLQKFLTSGTSVKVSHFLEQVGLDPDRFTDKIKGAGFSGKDADATVGQGYSMLCDLYISLFDELKGIAAKEKTALLKYFEDIGILNLSRFGVVDIGWNGTMQNCLSSILESMDKKPEIFGYYLGTTALAKEYKNSRSILSGYLVHFEEPASRYKVINDFIPMLELFHFAPHGSVVKIEERDGQTIPVFDGDCLPDKVKKTSEMHRGILDFIRDYLKVSMEAGRIEITPETAFSPVQRLFQNPTYYEASNIGDIWVVDGNVRTKKFIAKPPSLIKTLLSPGKYEREYNLSLWKEGFKKRKSEQGFLNALFKRAMLPKGDKTFFNDKAVQKRVNSFIKENNDKKVCFYGAGRFAEDFISDFDLSELNIIGFIDKNAEKAGQKLGQYTIHSPESIDIIKPDIVVITVLEPRYVISYIHTLQLQAVHKFKVIYDLFY